VREILVLAGVRDERIRLEIGLGARSVATIELRES
jgi:hypothetical protein